MKKNILFIVIFLLIINLSAMKIEGNPKSWQLEDFIGFDKIGDSQAETGDISSVFVRLENKKMYVRFTFDDMVIRKDNEMVADRFLNRDIKLQLFVSKKFKTIYSGEYEITKKYYRELSKKDKLQLTDYLRTPENNLLEFALNWEKKINKEQLYFGINIIVDGKIADTFSGEGRRNHRGGNCAFVQHGNQGLTYTEVFRGQYPQETSGYDEVLEVHQATGVPGNFHMAGTLITAAEWHDPDFNDWLRTGVSEGWAAMLTSAYAQHIMPFATDEMNNWAVYTEKELVNYVYDYVPKVAWVPERVWLADGTYPDAGLSDSWLGDNWTQHGVEAVILDDSPHLDNVGYDKSTKITWMNNGSGITLRVIPIYNDFVGQVQYDPDAAKATISGTGDYGIAIYGTDWEASAEMNEHHDTFFLDNYENIIWWCHDNYPAVNTWKLDDAINNSNFDTPGVDIVKGTYFLLGGYDGYGGSNNSWYTDWASTASHSDFHSPAWDYGTVWYDAFSNLMDAPDNNISQLGWYTMMTNLHETGWHDDGAISGWVHRYSSHIKNANVYEEASHWLNGEYADTTNAFMSDIDHDGGDELIIHNDKIFMVFEGIGGKANWIFTKDCNGVSVVGSDNVYWSETDGDYNESSYNHFAALSDVSPNYQNDIYSFVIDYSRGNEAQVSLYDGVIHKVVRVTTGNNYAEVIYYAGDTDVYIKSGWTPDYLATIWNVNWERVWDNDVAYMGQKNLNSGATVAYVLNDGGTNHVSTFEGTLVKGDEIHGYDKFKFLLFAGWTDSTYSQLEALQSLNLDEFPPELYEYAQKVDNNIIQLSFDEAVEETTAENSANYSFSGFSNTYTIDYVERQSNWNVIYIYLNENLIAGDAGNIIVNNVEDLNGNRVNDNSSAYLEIPNGITPHHIFIDGTNDFDQTTERIQENTDTLFITWDADYLYIGFESLALDSLGDFFVNIDVNQNDTLGAVSDSWSRVNFSGKYLPEYQIAIEGHGSSIQLNSWSESRGWSYSHYPGNGCGSYEGWVENPYTEISIPWSGLGNPTGIAISVHTTEEDNQVVTNVFPDNNPVGDNPTFTQAFMFYPPEIDGDMPLMEYEPYNVNYSQNDSLDVPENITITVDSDSVHISWDSVSQASSYKIYSSTDPYLATEDWTFEAETSELEWSEALGSEEKKFYYVTANN